MEGTFAIGVAPFSVVAHIAPFQVLNKAKRNLWQKRREIPGLAFPRESAVNRGAGKRRMEWVATGEKVWDIGI